MDKAAELYAMLSGKPVNFGLGQMQKTGKKEGTQARTNTFDNRGATQQVTSATS